MGFRNNFILVRNSAAKKKEKKKGEINRTHYKVLVCKVITGYIPSPNEGTQGQTYVLNSFHHRILFGYSHTYTGQILCSGIHLGFGMGWNSKDLLQ